MAATGNEYNEEKYKVNQVLRSGNEPERKKAGTKPERVVDSMCFGTQIPRPGLRPQPWELEEG